MKYLNFMIEDAKYYDRDKKEIKDIIKYTKPKGKTVIDIGAGIGRLSFPLSKYAKEIIALDNDKRLRPHYKRNKKKNIKFVNKNLKDFSSNKKKFDIILIAWPTFNSDFINYIKKLSNKETIIIFISCYNNSDFEKVPDNFIDNSGWKEDASNKERFMKLLKKELKIIKKKSIKTDFTYPNEKTAFKILNENLKWWFNMKLNDEDNKKLKEIIKKHEKKNQIRFKEKIYFWVMKLK